jgi:hypothetical protein
MGIRLDFPAGFLAAALLLLGACSGGGGSGASAVPAPTPVVPPVAAGGASVSLQGANTAVTYQAASATALVTNTGVAGITAAAPGQGATISITTDASGLTKIVFSVPTTGTTFTQQYTYSVWDYGGPVSGNAPTTANLVAILRDVYGFPNTTGSAITQSIGTQSLNSAAYGFWASGDSATTGRAGTFAFGNLTPAASVPATGSATFSGITIGVGGATSGSTAYALQGKAQIIANFATQSVTTNLTNLGTQNISTNALGSLPDLAGTSTISGNGYTGPIAGSGLTGTINGNFYGPSAHETAGVWQASGGGNSWIGSYGAK